MVLSAHFLVHSQGKEIISAQVTTAKGGSFDLRPCPLFAHRKWCVLMLVLDVILQDRQDLDPLMIT